MPLSATPMCVKNELFPDALQWRLRSIVAGTTLREAYREYNIPATTFHNNVSGKSNEPKKSGQKIALFATQECVIPLKLAFFADFSYAIDTHELRYFIKSYIEQAGCYVPQFEDNLSGPDWVLGFLNWQSAILSNRYCQNLSYKCTSYSIGISLFIILRCTYCPGIYKIKKMKKKNPYYP